MKDKVNKIIQADCLDYLKSLPDGCVSCFLIDEPYLLLKGHKIEEGYNLDIAKQVRIEAMRVLKRDLTFIFYIDPIILGSRRCLPTLQRLIN